MLNQRDPMLSHGLLLNWALFVTLIAVGAVIVASLGWFGKIYELDLTKISFLILTLFVVSTGWCGFLTWQTSKTMGGVDVLEFKHPDACKYLENQAEHGWFAAGLCEKLGLTGTVFGFIIMLVGAFQGFEAGNEQATRQLLEQLSSGMATAFITTLVGVVCSILLSVQYHNLSNVLDWELKK